MGGSKQAWDAIRERQIHEEQQASRGKPNKAIMKETNNVPAIRKKSIYNIQHDHLQLMQQIEDLEGEITPEIAEQLAINESSLQEKAVSYGYVIRQLDYESKQIGEEISRLSGLLSIKNKLKDDLKERIGDAMLKFNITKIDHDNLKLSFRKSKQLVITEGAHIPSGYTTIKEVESIDKAGLKKAIESGQEFEGIFIHENQNLQIR